MVMITWKCASDSFMILHVIDKVCSSCCCLFIHSMVTHQSATDGVTAGVETQCGECFYQWPVAMQCLSQEERRTGVCLPKCLKGQMSDREIFCKTEATGERTLQKVDATMVRKVRPEEETRDKLKKRVEM